MCMGEAKIGARHAQRGPQGPYCRTRWVGGGVWGGAGWVGKIRVMGGAKRVTQYARVGLQAGG